MNGLRLVQPSVAYAEQIAAFRKEFLDCGDSLDGTSNLSNYPDVREWLKWLDTLSAPETCPKGFVVSTQWLLVRERDEKVIGMINLRHTLNDYLLKYGGHIGYATRPDERHKGYAKIMLGLALAQSAEVGLKRVLITCNKENEASRRTILALDGVLENELWDEDEKTLVQRYWVTLT